MNIYFCHFNSIQSPSFTISFCTCNNNFLYRWKKSACGLKHLSNLNAQLPLSYCIVRRHTFGKSRIFLLPNNITPRTFHNSMYTLLSFHIYPHSISHLLKWKTTQGCYVQHLHVPRGPESAVCLQPQACESLLELRSYSGYWVWMGGSLKKISLRFEAFEQSKCAITAELLYCPASYFR